MKRFLAWYDGLDDFAGLFLRIAVIMVSLLFRDPLIRVPLLIIWAFLFARWLAMKISG